MPLNKETRTNQNRLRNFEEYYYHKMAEDLEIFFRIYFTLYNAYTIQRERDRERGKRRRRINHKQLYFDQREVL